MTPGTARAPETAQVAFKPKDTTGAERQRRYRQRQREGAPLVTDMTVTEERPLRWNRDGQEE